MNNLGHQLKAAGLHQSVPDPSCHQHGRDGPAGFNLTMTAPAGTIYYTLDGSDPRLPDGTVSPAALVYSAPIPLNQNTVVKARALLNGVWSALEKASFSLDVAALKVTELMYNPLPQPGSPYSKDDFG